MLKTKSSTGAYSFLKLYAAIPAGEISAHRLCLSANLNKRKRPTDGIDDAAEGPGEGAKDDAAEAEGDAEAEVQGQDPATTMSLKQIQLCGSETIQDHEQYKRLFGETPNVVSSLDLKILSTRLETAVWDSSSAPAWLRQCVSVYWINGPMDALRPRQV